jgi:hypothetical protein
MKKILMSIYAFLLIANFPVTSSAQESHKDIDPSKPTNLYSQVGLAIDYKSSSLENLYGIRGSISYAINSDNLFLAEVPVLRNDLTGKTGLSDIRLRYFCAVKRDISPTLIAIAPFADISIPTGSYDDGLGTSSWILSGGGVIGLMFSEQFGLFPGVGIMYMTKPGTNSIPEDLKFSATGISFQFNASYSFDKDTYIFINPTPAIMNTNGVWKTSWSGDFSFNRMLVPNKLQLGVYWGPNFTEKTNSFRLGLSSFF